MFRANRRPKECQARPRRSSLCESLENRLLFITYQVTGTAGPDSISISISGNDIISVVNGVSDSGSDIINNNIEILSLGGNDTISITETGNNTVVINSAAGNDTINIGNGANNLDVIDDVVSINGGTETDLVVFHDQNHSGSVTWNIDGTSLDRTGSFMTTFGNVENVNINGTASGDFFAFVGAPGPHMTLDGNGGVDRIVLGNTMTSAVTVNPSGTTAGSGSLTHSADVISYVDVEQMAENAALNVNLVTPNAVDNISISGGLISGNSGGVAVIGIFANSPGTPYTVDLAANDAGGGSDTITMSGSNPELIRLDAGTGNNTLNVNGGSSVVTTSVGVDGVNLDVTVNGGTLGFSGTQTLDTLTINNGGAVDYVGSSTAINANLVRVTSGEGNISVGSGKTGNISGGTLSIGAGRTLHKTGGGTLNINSAQNHGASLFSNEGGTTTFNTDCGSVASRPLDLLSNFGIVNLNATQHVDSLATNFGNINVGANGNRVVVTNSVSIGGEGGAINLNDNDMVVDYTGISQLSAVRGLIVGGFNNGLWNGLGIGSGSAAAAQATPNKTGLGYAEATQIFTTFPATFVGQQVDNTAVLVRYTLLGDSDLNNVPDIGDFAFLASNFNTTGAWRDGDYTYDGQVNINDFALQASNFNKVLPGDLPRGSFGTGNENSSRTSIFGNRAIDLLQI